MKAFLRYSLLAAFFIVPMKAQDDLEYLRTLLKKTNGFMAKRDPEIEKLLTLDALLALSLPAKDNDAPLSPPGNILFAQYFIHNKGLHRELLAQFALDHPKLLDAAKASAGNMHNPKVFPLGQVFPETLLKTPTVRKLDEKLQARGYRIKRVSCEKFSLDKTTDPITFRAILWFEVGLNDPP